MPPTPQPTPGARPLRPPAPTSCSRSPTASKPIWKLLAYAETVDNGKPIRETLNADIPLAVDHFRYFAGCLRAQEGALSDIDENTVAYHYHEPLGVVGQIIPWNFPILMAAWKLAPAIGAGNCVVLKPAESTPISILVLAEMIADLLPAVC
jgi:aldehyde dehydrogenase